MNRKVIIGLLLTLIFAPSVSFSEERNEEIVVFKNVELLTMESDEMLSNKTLIVDAGTISWIGDSEEVEIPDDARVIEGSYYLMPGLQDLYTRVYSSWVNGDYIKNMLKLYLVSGVTQIRNVNQSSNVSSEYLDLRASATDGEIVSPRIITSGPPVSTPDQIEEQAERGYDLIAIETAVNNRDLFYDLADSAQEHGVPVVGRLIGVLSYEDSWKAGLSSVLLFDRLLNAASVEEPDLPRVMHQDYHLTHQIDENRLSNIISETVNQQIWNVPANARVHQIFQPNIDFEELKREDYMAYLSEEKLDIWKETVESIRNDIDFQPEQGRDFLELRKRITRKLHEEGGNLLLGTASPYAFVVPGYSAHKELELFVEAGISPYEALQTATTNPADYLDEDGKSGKLKSGYRADILVLEENPLESIPFQNHIAGVMRNGDYYGKEEIKEIKTYLLDKSDSYSRGFMERLFGN